MASMSARRLSAYTEGGWVCPGSLSVGSGGSAAGAASGTAPSRRKAAVNGAKVEAMAAPFAGEGSVPLSYAAGRVQARGRALTSRLAGNGLFTASHPRFLQHHKR